MTDKKSDEKIIKEETNTTEIALNKDDITQDDIPTLLQAVNEKIKDVKGDLPKTNTTTVKFDAFGAINSMISLEVILKAASVLLLKEKAYNEAVQEFLPEGIKAPKFKINGHTAEEWKSDFRRQAILVGNRTKLEKLKKIKSTLEANLSAEAKLKNDLKNIMTILEDE
jgi:hypothetical protein